MIYRISRCIAWVFFKICFGYRVRNVRNVPEKGPFIIAGNHLSFLDPMAVGFATKEKVHFLARASLFVNPVLNWWAANVGVIPISRGRFDISAIKGTLDCLKKGKVVALFPEGTRSADGIIKEAKAGVGYVAAKSGAPVVPICVIGSDKALPRQAIFVRFKHVEVRVAEPVLPEMFLKSNGEYDYQALSEEVMERIKKLSRD